MLELVRPWRKSKLTLVLQCEDLSPESNLTRIQMWASGRGLDCRSLLSLMGLLHHRLLSEGFQVIKWKKCQYLLCQLLLEREWMSLSFGKGNGHLISFCLFFPSWFPVKVLIFPVCNIVPVISWWIHSMS